jgi:hypothetical protein
MKWTTSLVFVALAFAVPSRALSEPTYEITTLGLQGVEHTRNDGYLFSMAQKMTEAGQVAGYSQRWLGGGSNLGHTVWMYDGSTIHHIGLIDAEHTRSDGYKNSVIWHRSHYVVPGPQDDLLVNEAGFVAGLSLRFNGESSDLGQSAWLFNGTTTEKIGLTDAEHTRTNGERSSTVSQLNRRGRAAGSSNRYRAAGVRGSSSLGTSAWFYDGTTTRNIGLVAAEHTRDDGYKESSVRGLLELGHVVGFSFRYNGGNTSLGGSAWLYDGVSTLDIGLVDAEHTSIAGSRYSYPMGQFETGHVLGLANRYNGGSNDLGQTIWMYDGSATSIIGLIGSEHTRHDGYKRNAIYQYTPSGHVAGYANRYDVGGADLGDSVWLYDGSTTIEIGLINAEHTRSDGYMSSSFAFQSPLIQNALLTDGGLVAGYSYRYQGGNTQLGNSAWLYNGISSIHIGLIGTEHTRDDGYRSISSREINEAGQVTGTAVRYNGGASDRGLSAWLYDGTTTHHIGLTDAEHTRDDGYKESSVSKLSDSGSVVGSSARYNGGSTSLGSSAWLYAGVSTLNIGLVGPEYTRSDGYRRSIAYMNAASHVVGYSFSYNSGENEFNDFGLTTWTYDGATTKVIGLTDAVHTDDVGLQFSRMGPQNLVDDPWFNSAGQVIGISARYLGGSTQNGTSGWFYDPQLDETIPLILSTRSDGFAYSFPDYLGEDGLVLGTYTLFDELDNNLGDRLFYFTLDEGLHDLGALVSGGLAANGWEQLANWLRVNGTEHILGHGLLTSQVAGQMPYLLTLQSAVDLPGDYNDDGFVNAADYTVWRNNLGAPAGTLPNDIDGGEIGQAHYETWRAHYGATIGTGASDLHSQTSVPEPATAMLFLLACLPLLRRRQRPMNSNPQECSTLIS